MATHRCKTEYYPELIAAKSAATAFEYFIHSISWEEGPRYKRSPTRLVKQIQPGADPVVDELLDIALQAVQQSGTRYRIVEVQLNYYLDGSYYTPSHCHKGSTQLIISLGGRRTLRIGAKDYELQNGDVITFGTSNHSVPAEATLKGCITVAALMERT